jgi:hypothetical protein
MVCLLVVECALRDDPGGVEALHRTTDDLDLEQRKARRQPLLLGMVVAVAVASLLQVAVLRTGAPMDFMARYAAGGLVDRGRSPSGPSSSRPLFAAIWLCLRRPQTRQVIALGAGLAVVALCKPQFAYLPVAVVLVHGYRCDR